MAEKEHEKKKKSNLPVLTLSNSMGENRFRGQEVDLLELIGGGALVAAAAEDPGEHVRGGGSTLAAATGGLVGGDSRAAQSNGNGRDGERKGQKWKAGRDEKPGALWAFGGCRSGPGRFVLAFEHPFCQYLAFVFSRYFFIIRSRISSS